MALSISHPVEVGQVYRDGFNQSQVEIDNVFISEDGQTEVRVTITKPDGDANSRTLDAMSVFKRIRNDDLTLIEEVEA